jgi:hypothetical protein
MCVCKKGFIPHKDLYPLCHFYFSDLQLLIADKLFCNQITNKALWERLYSFHYEPRQTKQTSIQQFYAMYSRLQDFLPP